MNRPPSEIQTARLLLRMIRPSDLDAYAEMCADSEVMRHVTPGRPLSREEAWREMAVMAGHWALRGYGMWAVEHRQTGDFVGRIGLWNPEGWPDLEVGWMLRRRFWGLGFATEGARAALNYAFDDMGLDHVVSLIRVGNVASVRVAERLGERLERQITVGAIEALIYGIRNPRLKAGPRKSRVVPATSVNL